MEGAMKLYSKMKKKSKTHRSVLDMNLGDVCDIENIDRCNNYSNNKSDDRSLVKREIIGVLLKKMESL